MSHARCSELLGQSIEGPIEALADERGIGELYQRLRDGVRGIFFAQGYAETVAYVRRVENGGVRTVMFVDAVPGDDTGGVKFVAHATRFERYMDVSMDDLRTWLPRNTIESDVRGWNGSSPEERGSAQGLEGLFHSTEEVGSFVEGLSAELKERSRSDGGEPA